MSSFHPCKVQTANDVNTALAKIVLAITTSKESRIVAHGTHFHENIESSIQGTVFVKFSPAANAAAKNKELMERLLNANYPHGIGHPLGSHVKGHTWFAIGKLIENTGSSYKKETGGNGKAGTIKAEPSPKKAAEVNDIKAEPSPKKTVAAEDTKAKPRAKKAAVAKDKKAEPSPKIETSAAPNIVATETNAYSALATAHSTLAVPMHIIVNNAVANTAGQGTKRPSSAKNAGSAAKRAKPNPKKTTPSTKKDTKKVTKKP